MSSAKDMNTPISMFAVIAAMLLPAICARAGAPPEPPDRVAKWQREYFGDARNVELLAGLLGGDDVRVREQAVRGLGETRNKLAIGHLQKAMADPAVSIRVAAVTALGSFSDQTLPAILAGLKDTARDVQFAAMRLARSAVLDGQRAGVAPAAGQIKALLKSDDATLQADAICTLTRLSVAADGKTLAALLKSRSSAVRLWAAKNAAFVSDAAESREINNSLTVAAAQGNPMVRCEALRSLGKIDFEDAKSLLEASGDEKNQLVRMGVVQGYELARQGAKVRPFLDDPDPMVRLAAIRAAGELVIAGSADRLFELMLQAPPGEMEGMNSHVAARDSLIAIHSDAVPQIAAAKLPDLLRYYLDVPRLQAELIKRYRESNSTAGKLPDFTRQNLELMAKWLQCARNIGSCFRLLGAYRSKLSLDIEIELVKSEPADSRLMVDLVWSLGQIGDAKAVAPLEALLAKYVTLGREKLSSIGAMPPPIIPYNDEAAGEVVQALVQLKATGATDNILTMGTMKVGDYRLGEPVFAAMKCCPRLQTPANAARIEAMFSDLIQDSHQSALRYSAIAYAAKQGRQQSLPAIRKLLEQERPGQTLMGAAAWAIWKLTGQAPKVPDPATVQGSNWIIQTSHRK